METRPFRVLGIQQIAVGALDKGDLAKLWIDLFGLERTGNYRNDRENVDEDIVRIGKGALAVVRFTPGGIRRGAGGHEVCFIHPKGNDEFPVGGQGTLIELVQAPPEVIAALG
jgi:lactoylglutathione lyase